MDEEMLLKKYDPYISKQARSYLLRTSQPEHLYDDLKSEAAIAFIKTVRRWGFDDYNLTPYQFKLIHNAIRSAFRRCVWSANEMRDKNKPLTVNSITFTDVIAQNDSFDDSKLDFLVVEDDYSRIELRDMMDRLTQVERETLDLLMRGYSWSEIASIRHTSKKNVGNTVNRLRVRLKDVA